MREAREAHGVSLRKLAKQLGYQSHTTLSGYERGAIMPTDAVVAGYEQALGVEPGSLMAVLEAARIERHGDAWPKRRMHVPAEFVHTEGDAVAERVAAAVTTPEPMPQPRRHRRLWVWGGAVVLVLAVGALIAVVLTNQPAAHGAYPDGSDPKVTGCAVDAETTSSVDVYYPASHLVGTLELRTSDRCGMSWGRFTPTAALAVSPTVQLEIDAHRPADGAVARFGVTYDGLAAYGNMLESDHECVYATLTLQTRNLGASPSFQTGCEQ
jgi:transcriptional regulator with XRE-family HTH domain